MKDVINHNFFVLTSDTCENQGSRLYGYYFTDDMFNLSTNIGTLLDKETSGAYVNIQLFDNKIIIQQDYNCTFGLYIFKDRDYWAVSNSFFLLLNYLSASRELTINDDYLALYRKNLQFFSFRETSIKEIKELPHGHFIKINLEDHAISVHKYQYEKSRIDISSRAAITILDTWHLKYSRLINNLCTSHKIIADLSGGFDSRAALSILFKPDIFNKVNIFSRDDDIHTHKEDYEIASKIAKRYGFCFSLPEENRMPISSWQAILNTLSCKFFSHNQLYFKNTYSENPIFSLNGNGGEAIREYYAGSFQDFIDRYAKKDSVAKACLEREAALIAAEYDEDIPEAQKLYLYSRCKNHFGRSIVESFLSNMISISPLMDPSLRKINLKPKQCPDRNSLIALILVRYMPEILNLGFDSEKILTPEVIDFATRLNQEFPFHISKNDEDLPCTLSITSHPYHEKFPIDQTATEHFVELYQTDKVRKEVTESMGGDFYERGIKTLNPSLYYGLYDIIHILNIFILRKILAAKRGLSGILPLIYKSSQMPDVLNQFDPLFNSLIFAIRIDESHPYIDRRSFRDSIEASGFAFQEDIQNFNYTKIFICDKDGIATIYLRTRGTPDAKTSLEFMVDLCSIDIIDMATLENVARYEDIDCIGESPVKFRFAVNKGMQLKITLLWKKNSLYYSPLDDKRDMLQPSSSSRKYASDVCSNMYNI